MQQRRSLTRGTIILAAAVAVVLVIVSFSMNSNPAQARVSQGSNFVAYDQGTQDPGGNSNKPDKTKEPDKTQALADDKKITICHLPPGNPGNGQTITISVNAWKTDGSGEGGHGPGLHGGDYVGPCKPNAEAALASTADATAGALTTCGLEANNPCPTDNAQQAAKVWVPVTINAAACVDWTFYHSDRTGNLNIFRLGALPSNTAPDADVSKGSGSNVQDMSPASSPDGQHVAFTSNRTGNWEIYIGTADGSTQQRVTYTTSAANLSPMWSPDGKSIVYETTRNGSRDIYLADVATGQETRLTDSTASDVNPFWSPDSQKILFQTNRDGLWQIYELNLSSKAWRRLSHGESNDINPQYSRDGKQIVFRSYKAAATNNTVIYTMNADGSNRLAISDSKGNTLNPSWSPDNTLIAYQSDLKGSGDIYVYEVSTRLTRQITDNTTLNSASTWHCNTSMLIYTSVVNGKPQLYQVSALPMDAKPVSAADSTQLTNDNASNTNPQGSPSIEDASHRTQEGNASSTQK